MAIDWGKPPTETEDGEYKGRATYIHPCECCGEDTVFYRDDDESCVVQTLWIRREYLDLDEETIAEWVVAAEDGDEEAIEWLEALDELLAIDDSTGNVPVILFNRFSAN